MVVYPRKSGRVWVEPAARRVLAGRGGMGRPPRRFPRANGLSVPRVPTTERLPRRSLARWTNEQPLHLERGMTHDALKRYLESAPSLAELASVLIAGVDSDSLLLINLHAGDFGLEDPEYGMAGKSWRGGGGVWHPASRRASSRSGGV